MNIQINVPTAASLPKDWKSTAFGVLVAVALVLKEYISNGGSVSWQIAAIASFVAVVCYFIPAKPSAKDELELAAKVEKLVADLLTKQPAANIVVDSQALAQDIGKIVLASLVPATAAPSPAPAQESATAANPGASGAVS